MLGVSENASDEEIKKAENEFVERVKDIPGAPKTLKEALEVAKNGDVLVLQKAYTANNGILYNIIQCMWNIQKME